MMRNQEMMSRSLWLGLLMAALGTASAAAQEAYVCSVSQAMECDEQLDCVLPEGPPDPVQFFRVDVEADGGLLTALTPASREGEVTEIGAVARHEDDLILTGADADKGFSLLIATDVLDFTLTMSEDRVAWVVFGSCVRTADVAR